MILVLELAAAVIGAWFNGTRLTPVWGPASGATSDITTAGALGVRVGQPLIIGGRSDGEPVVVVRIHSATSFSVARSCRIGWRVVHRGWRF